MLSHYLINFIVVTLAVIAFLYVVFLLLKSNPQLLSGAASLTKRDPQNRLRIISRSGLEARKSLYVVGYDNKRFLIATSPDRTEFLSELPEEPIPFLNDSDANPLEVSTSEVAQMEAALSGQTNPMSEPHPVSTEMTGNTPWQRFQYSLKLVFSDRFISGKGK